MEEERLVALNWGNAFVKISNHSDRPWLTLLHTLATDQSLWEEQIDQLSRHYRLIRLDFRGHGQSDEPTSEFTLDDLVKDVVAIWDAIGIEHSAVAGISIGGMVALGLALDVPERVNAIIAAGCRARSSKDFQSLWINRRAMLDDDGMDVLTKATLPTWLTEQTRTKRPEIVERVERLIRGTSRKGYDFTTRALEGLDYQARLGEICLPSLLIVGEDDGPHPEEMKAIAGAIPTSRLAVIPGASHLSNIEKPDHFGKLMVDFLKENVKNASPA